MKKVYLFLSIGAMAMASCSSDDVVNPVDNTAKKSEAISFNVGTGNMSRYTDPANSLSKVSYDFGVWAYKANSEADLDALDPNAASDPYTGQSENTVMNNYFVGFWNFDNNVGYQIPATSQEPGTYWYYEGLGSAWTGNFSATDSQADHHANAANATQYLKYWDKAYAHTYFYAYAPYIAGVTFDPSKREMTFPEINGTTGAAWMYATASVENSTVDNVDLHFTRLGSQIRIAFYGEINGYKVEICNLGTGDDNKGVQLVPAHKSGDTYSVGSVLATATPVVKFDNSAVPGTATISYGTTTEDNLSFSNIVFAANSFTYKNGTTATEVKASKPTDLLYSPVLAVLPHGDYANDGFTLNVSLKLTATDTQEVTYVYGARVYVDATYTQWAPNTLYTYIFHITNKVPGVTGTPATPGVTPSDPDDRALVPIIFDQITVDEIDNAEIVNDHWDVGGNTTTGPDDNNCD